MDYINALEEALGIEANKNMILSNPVMYWKPVLIQKHCMTYRIQTRNVS